jgi:Ig-like domain from next to BRCA1 gene
MQRNVSWFAIGLGIAFVLILIALGVVCGVIYFLRPAQTATPAESDALYTQAAQTFVAQLTQTATILPPTSTGLSPSFTPPPTYTAVVPTNTYVPPTQTPLPPTATPSPQPCLWAKFMADVTVKDGTVFPPNTEFVKTWRLRNIGSCSWTPDYLVVFDHGDRMGGPHSVAIDEIVDPGETVDVSVDLLSPDTPGDYRGYWKLSTPSGQVFGIGSDTKGPFWVDINVLSSDENPLDFALSYCAAHWRSDAGTLPCPGDAGDDEGFVILVEDPVIEDNRHENEPALWTNPEHTNDGYISGEYPEIKIESGYHFKAVVGCLDGAEKCDVIFQVRYRIGDNDPVKLWETHEVYDDAFTKVDLDLSFLAGQKVKFILKVSANGSPSEDEAFWLAPHITD